MVRFKENNDTNTNININNEKNNDIDDNDKYNDSSNKKQIENNDINIDKFDINDNNNNKEINDIISNENKINIDNKNMKSDNFDKDINIDNYNENLIGENKQLLINKLKEEHKIGFKSKKNEAYKEPKISEENSEIDLKSDLNKNNDFSFDNFHIKSKSLKDMLKKKDE